VQFEPCWLVTRNHIDGRSLIAQRSCRSHDHRFDLDQEIQGHPHPEELILVGLASLQPCSIMFSIATPSAPDRRRGIDLWCIILNRTVKVQSSTAGECQMLTWGRSAAGAHPGLPLPLIRRDNAWYPCMDAQSRLDFDRSESKIAPDTADSMLILQRCIRPGRIPCDGSRSSTTPLRVERVSRVYELQTLAVFESAVNDILPSRGNLRRFTRRTAPDADGRKLSQPIRTQCDQFINVLNETPTARREGL